MKYSRDKESHKLDELCINSGSEYRYNMQKSEYFIFMLCVKFSHNCSLHLCLYMRHAC